jgi:hypothetical protein
MGHSLLVAAIFTHFIELEIYRLGHHFNVELEKIREAVTFMKEFDITDLSGKSPNTMGAAFLYMVVCNFCNFHYIISRITSWPM